MKLDRPRIAVDFNELLEPDLVLLSQTDQRIDSSNSTVLLTGGMAVYIYEDDDFEGKNATLIADGTVVPHPGTGFGTIAKWCCRIDINGIRRITET